MCRSCAISRHVNEIPMSCTLRSKGLKPITAGNCLSIPPENIRKPLGLLVFSGGIGKQVRAVMDYRRMALIFLKTFYLAKKRKEKLYCT